MKKPIIMSLVFVFGIFFASGCSTVRVWERAEMLDYKMRSDRDPLAQAMADHVYFSREASSGGLAVGGAGCGCN